MHRKPSRSRGALLALGLCVSVLVAVVGGVTAPAQAATGTVTGYVWDDADRDGIKDAGETPFSDIAMYLISSTSGAVVAVSGTDSTGHYSLSAPAGGYRLTIAGASWTPLKDNWTPTSTGSLQPSLDVAVSDLPATGSVGLRRIVRSTDTPVSRFVGPSGLTVESYNDVVSAQSLHDQIAATLLGGETAVTTVKFDLDVTNHTTSSWSGTAGSYNGYSSTVYASFRTWLDDKAASLTHEYGHAWSLYQAVIQRQDPDLAEYVRARGLEGDPRIGSSVYWQPREMVAEDYRQLFGSEGAASRPQANTEIPPPGQVPGLRDWLRDTFTSPVPGTPSPTPSPSPTPTPTPTTQALAITSLTADPVPVVSSTTISIGLSAPADVTLTVVDGRGRVVRTLLSSAAVAAGAVDTVWDRKDDRRRAVKAGTYSVRASATGGDGAAVSASASLKVV